MPSALEVDIELALHTLNATGEPSIGMLFEAIHRTKYTGSFIVHCDRGVPQLVELGRPIRVDLTRRSRTPLDSTG